MLNIKWTHVTIRTNAQAEQMRQTFYNTTHFAAAFDTEGTGLAHMRDVPFLYQFGWVDADKKNGYTYVVDIEQQPILAHQVIRVWHQLVKTVQYYVGHNVKFDLHMCANIGEPYEEDNLTDTMIYIRLGTDAVPIDKGGAPLGLKEFSARYVRKDAKEHERLIKTEKTSQASYYNNLLKKRLHLTKKEIDAMFKDVLFEKEDMPTAMQKEYEEWLNLDLPLYLRQKVTGLVHSDMIRYDKLNREMVIRYGHRDIVLTIETFITMHHVVQVRRNEDAVKRENACILPFYRMERVGFNADRSYLLHAKEKVKRYIKERREDMYTLAGCRFSIGQKQCIKDTLKQQYDIDVPDTQAETLERLCSDFKRNHDMGAAVDFIEVVQELRTLEKWYATYILRFMYDLQFSERLYTMLNQSNTVTGRSASDFQQFPKGAIKTITGEELFHPRKLITVTGGDYKGMVYLDYSQVELRLQAMYTILVGHPDLNLCRAYMPYKCFRINTQGNKEDFDYANKEHLKTAYTCAWYYEENPEEKWKPLDVHGATTKIAFNIDESHPDFHSLRYKGKRVNFAKNYGAQFNKIKTMFPEYSDEQIHRIDDAYYLAFPGVKEYHKYCYSIARLQAHVPNLFGVRYYGVSGHNLINTLVQGSGAYLLKEKIVEVDAYLIEKGYKSKMQMQIHDELSFEWHIDDDPKVFWEVKEIMETWDDALVPIVADMEITYTTWAEKKEVEGVEDFYV